MVSRMKVVQKNVKIHSYEVVPVSGRQSAAGGKIRITINPERCKGCGLCVDVCPKGNLRLSENINAKGHNYVEIIDADNCTGCGLCYQMCPDLVIEIENLSREKDSRG
jgi:2-oxoglutarate ferredoxin oxidoreductase subunit delta